MSKVAEQILNSKLAACSLWSVEFNATIDDLICAIAGLFVASLESVRRCC